MVKRVTMDSTKTAAWPKLHGAENKLLREQLGDFCQQTSFTPLVNIYRASNIFKKLAWSITFLVCLGWLSFQCHYLLERYFSYPFDVTMRVNSVTELDFPSVTVCNMNPLKSSLVKSGPLKSLAKFTKDNFKEDNLLYDKAVSSLGSSVKIGKRSGPGSGSGSGPSGDAMISVTSTMAAQITKTTGAAIQNPTSTPASVQGTTEGPQGPGPTTVGGPGPTTTPSPGSTTTPSPGPTTTPSLGPTTTPSPGPTTTPSPGPTTTPSPGPTTTPSPGPTTTPSPEPTTTPSPGPTTTPSPGPTTTPSPGPTTTPAPGSTNNQSPEPTTDTGEITDASTTEDPFEEEDGNKMNTEYFTPWNTYTTTWISDLTETYYDSINDYFMHSNFNQWDMLDNSNVTNFYTTLDSELDAALMYAHLSAEVSDKEVLETGHMLKDFMISCKFDGYPCSPQNFTAFHNHKYGNCYTFNHPERIESAKTRFAGPLYGLTLELYLEQSDYVPALSQEAGVRVVIHSRNATPFPEDEGVSVAPGYATSIGIEAIEMVRLGPPHSDCANSGTTDDLYQLHSAYDYTKISCMKSCYQKLIIKNCGCETPFYYVENKENVCNMSNEDTAWCVINIESTGQAEYKSCNAKCPPACVERKYEKSISAAEWPSNNYKDQLTTRFQTSRSSFMGDFSLENDQLKEFVKLRVYYQEMVYKSIEDTKSYESMNLISDIGGQLGLWLGLSAITIGELCSCILLVVRGLSSKMCSSRTTPVEKVKLDQMS